MLRLVIQNFVKPAENIAMDEALLDGVNDGHTEATLRIWESPVPFVVLGTGQAVHDVVHVENCQLDNVPILRRCTAGGCVLQGPGSLNFALALDFHSHPQVKNLHDSYCWVLKQLSAAFATFGVESKHEGVCDLTINGQKISGNAQRRRRNALLHHGTLLYNFDPASMRRYLPEPKDQPVYRVERIHETFLTTIPLSPEQITEALISAFEASESPLVPTPWELQSAHTLAIQKYQDPAWTLRR